MSESIIRDKLEAAIRSREATAGTVVARTLEEVPVDSIVRGSALSWQHRPVNLPAIRPANYQDPVPVLEAAYPDQDGRTVALGMHPHAFRQVAERAGVPTQYAEALNGGEEWQRALLRHTLAESYQHAAGRYLVRSVKGEMRGFLSDRFRRLDVRPLLETFVSEATARGAVPFEGLASDVRVQLKALIPTPVEVVPGEWVALGAEWANSDYGAGKYRLALFILRVLCINGLVGSDLISQVHLGGRLDSRLEYSRRTYELDTATMRSATRDLVKVAFSEETRQAQIGKIREVAAKQIDAGHLARNWGKALTKDELAKVREAYEGPDVENLPPGPTAWRATQALAWVARTLPDDRRLDLERLAGQSLAA